MLETHFKSSIKTALEKKEIRYAEKMVSDCFLPPQVLVGDAWCHLVYIATLLILWDGGEGEGWQVRQMVITAPPPPAPRHRQMVRMRIFLS